MTATRVRRCLPLAAAASLLAASVPSPAHASMSWAARVQDPTGDLTALKGWKQHASARPLADIEQVFYAADDISKRLTVTWEMVKVTGPQRGIKQVLTARGTLKTAKVALTATVDPSSLVGSLTTTASDGKTASPCADQITTAYDTTEATVKVSVPVACLPAGKKLKRLVAGATSYAGKRQFKPVASDTTKATSFPIAAAR